ncbi:hypothetical protein B7C42_01618 [Nocardia cerradoensis]|uniref:Uncharacterized protein n=1 Tax=Nocardia cerradoensis TaxID=85688 RepID=A0A231HCG7_9NOCA|nr:hypothetical protein [Nocardia cerradoensis]OXR46644.1 hypothetical protein B7C42_01618 [Nocardia cerradoensis]
MITDSLAAVWFGGFTLGAGLTALGAAVVLFVSALRMRNHIEPELVAEPDDITDEDQAAELLPEWNSYA